MSTIVASAASSGVFLGETIRFYITGVTDLNGNPINAPTTVQVDLVRATDGSHASGFPTTSGSVADGNGQFHYDYSVGSTDIIGQWSVLWTITNGSYVNEAACNFAVNEFSGQLILTQIPTTAPVAFAYAFQVLATDPTNPTPGQAWFNTTTSAFKVFNGSKVLTIPLPTTGTVQYLEPPAYFGMIQPPTNPIDSTLQPMAIDARGNVIVDTNGIIQSPSGGTVGNSTVTNGLNELLTALPASGGLILVAPNPSGYDNGANSIIAPNDRAVKIRGLAAGSHDASSPSTAPSVFFIYSGSDWALKTNGTAPTTNNCYCDIENIGFSLTGGNYLGGLKGFNLVLQLKGLVTVVDFSASGSSRVAGSYGVAWDYGTTFGSGTGSNGFEIVCDALYVKGFDIPVYVNVDHFMIHKVHFLFGHTSQLQIGNAGYYPLNPTFGDLHFVAGNSNTVTNMISIPCTASDSIETWTSNIYIEAVSGGAYTHHFNIQTPVRASRGFTIGMLHGGTVSTTGNYQHINALSRDGMAAGQFGFGYSTPAIPSTASFTNTNYYSVTIFQTATPGGTLTITDVKGNAVTVGTPTSFTLQPGESGQFASSGPSAWSWYANIN